MKKIKRAILVLFVSVLLLCIPMTVCADASPLKTGVFRIGGATRYETSVLAADALKDQNGGEKFNTVILASGKNFPDALAGSYLANQKQAPLIMVGDKNSEYIYIYI